MDYQSMLTRKRDVTLLFVEGLVGRNFSKTLAFYLDHFQEYLDGFERMEDKMVRRDRRGRQYHQTAADLALMKALNRGCGE
jgi:hypothetical protein